MSKPVGFIRKIEKKGRLCIPVDILRKMDWFNNPDVEVIPMSDGFMVRNLNRETVLDNAEEIMEFLYEHEDQFSETMYDETVNMMRLVVEVLEYLVDKDIKMKGEEPNVSRLSTRIRTRAKRGKGVSFSDHVSECSNESFSD